MNKDCNCCCCKRRHEQDRRIEEERKRGKGLLEESSGKTSAMRVMSFIALFAAIGYTYMVLSKEEPSNFGVFIITGWLIASFAPKAIQKFAEKDILQSR